MVPKVIIMNLGGGKSCSSIEESWFDNNVQWKIGSGTRIKFWEDIWLDDMPLMHSYSTSTLRCMMDWLSTYEAIPFFLNVGLDPLGRKFQKLFFLLWSSLFSYLFGVGFSSTLLAFADNVLTLVVAHSYLLVSLTMMCVMTFEATSSYVCVLAFVYIQFKMMVVSRSGVLKRTHQEELYSLLWYLQATCDIRWFGY